jgi:hypothetical protein
MACVTLVAFGSEASALTLFDDVVEHATTVMDTTNAAAETRRKLPIRIREAYLMHARLASMADPMSEAKADTPPDSTPDSSSDSSLGPPRSRPVEDEDDWVEVRRFDDAIGATMIRDFLVDHDVRCAIRGNPQATRMTWSQTTDNLRVVVPAGDLDKAKEALEAMSAGDTHPFRGAAPRDEDDEGPESKFVKPRSAIGAAMLAVFVPIGAGHFYARHGAAGTMLCVGMLGSAGAAIVLGHAELFRAWGILVIVDIIGSYFAVRRFNQHRIPPENVQRMWGFIAVIVAFGIAWMTR